jgi:cysteine desulfuration protein SufE
MTVPPSPLPPRLQAIVAEFAGADGPDKLELLLEYADEMPPLPPGLTENHAAMERIHECMTPVFVHAETVNGQMHFAFDVPPESPTVRGFAAILGLGLDGATPAAVLALPGDFFEEMGLQKVLSPQRLNGIVAITRYIKNLARREVGA